MEFVETKNGNEEDSPLEGKVRSGKVKTLGGFITLCHLILYFGLKIIHKNVFHSYVANVSKLEIRALTRQQPFSPLTSTLACRAMNERGGRFVPVGRR